MGQIAFLLDSKAGGKAGEKAEALPEMRVKWNFLQKGEAAVLPRSRDDLNSILACQKSMDKWNRVNGCTSFIFLLCLAVYAISTFKVMRNLCIENQELRIMLANENRIRGILSVAVVEYVPREQFEKRNYTESEVADYADLSPDLHMTTFRSVITWWSSSELSICQMWTLSRQLAWNLYHTPQHKARTEVETSTETWLSGAASDQDSGLSTSASVERPVTEADQPQLDDEELALRLENIRAATKHLEAQIDRQWLQKESRLPGVEGVNNRLSERDTNEEDGENEEVWWDENKKKETLVEKLKPDFNVPDRDFGKWELSFEAEDPDREDEQ